MTIECISFKAINKGSLIGFADLFVPKMGLEIYGCALFQKDGRKWVSFPQKETVDANGEKKYFSQFRFREKSHMEAFSKAAVEAISKKYTTDQKPVEEEPDLIPF